MHRTLTPRFNLAYIALCLAGLSLAFVFASWRPFISVIGITLPLGALAGILQRRALDGRPAEFLGARTAMDVRRALVASLPGTISIVLLRVTAVAVLVWAVSANSQGRISLWVAGFTAFSIARDLIVLPALLRLSQLR